MSSAEADPADHGLLSPGWAGSAAETATSDTAFLQAMLDAEAALTRAQAATGLAPAAAAKAVTAAADADRFDVRDLALRARSGGNPVIPLVKDLTAAVGEASAAYVHRGATSQDILDTAAMLVASRTLALILADLARTADALARLAAAHRDTPMPGRTLTQHAVPTTFGLKAAGWRSLVLDAYDRLAAVRSGLPAQLGGAAGTLAAFDAWAGSDDPAADHATEEAGGGGVRDVAAYPWPAPDGPEATAAGGRRAVDVRVPDPATGGPGLRLLTAYARATGLAEPTLPWHTLRTPVADLAGALALTTGALGKTAADVLTLTRTEIGELAEGTGGGSSAMPHKANPVRATLIAAAARRAPALAAVLYGSLVAEDERPPGAWHAEWQTLRDLLRLAGGAARDAAELAEGLRVHPARMREHLGLTGGLIVTERLAAAFAPLVGRDHAKALLTRAAARAREGHVSLGEALADDPGLAGLLTPDQLHDLTDPTHYTGSAAALTDRALARTARPENAAAASGPRTEPDARPATSPATSPATGEATARPGRTTERAAPQEDQ